MKVIAAGFSKTGTKSLHAALKELGYEVYDSPDHFWYHRKEWMKIISSGAGGTVEDFQKMYANVDAVVDIPASLFWQEIHEAFPDAKIVLTIRDEDKFYKSYCVQAEKFRSNKLFDFLNTITFTGRRFVDFFKVLFPYYVPVPRSSSYDFEFAKNEMMIKRSYRHHQLYCMQNAPKDKLLVYHVSEGWEPLCKFLGKEVPEKQFPHENIAGRILEDLMKKHPLFHQMKRESLIALALIVGVSSFIVYKLISRNWLNW